MLAVPCWLSRAWRRCSARGLRDHPHAGRGAHHRGGRRGSPGTWTPAPARDRPGGTHDRPGSPIPTAPHSSVRGDHDPEVVFPKLGRVFQMRRLCLLVASGGALLGSLAIFPRAEPWHSGDHEGRLLPLESSLSSVRRIASLPTRPSMCAWQSSVLPACFRRPTCANSRGRGALPMRRGGAA